MAGSTSSPHVIVDLCGKDIDSLRVDLETRTPPIDRFQLCIICSEISIPAEETAGGEAILGAAVSSRLKLHDETVDNS
jgi:hypothetical protein